MFGELWRTLSSILLQLSIVTGFGQRALLTYLESLNERAFILTKGLVATRLLVSIYYTEIAYCLRCGARGVAEARGNATMNEHPIHKKPARDFGYVTTNKAHEHRCNDRLEDIFQVGSELPELAELCTGTFSVFA